MSLTQKRLLSLGIAIQRRADVDLRRPRIYTNDFARLFGLSGNSIHKTIADASKGLLDLKVFIDLGEGSFRGYNWVTEAAYIGQRKSEVNLAYSEFAFNSTLKEFLLNLEGHFQSYALQDISNLTRVSSWRLYEILLADTFGFAQGRGRVRYDVDKLKYLLDVPTMLWRDFRRVIFEQAQADHAEEIGLVWHYERVTEGRKVVALDITIVKAPKWNKPDAAVPPEGVSPEDLDLLTLRNELSEIGFTYSPERYLKELGVETVRQLLKACLREQRDRDRTSGATSIRNLAGYFHERLKKALSEAQGQPSLRFPDPQAFAEPAGTVLSDEQLSRLAASLMAELSEARKDHAREIYDALDPKLKQQILGAMKAELDPIRLQLYENANWSKEVLIGSWVFYALKLMPDLFPVALQSPDAFLHEHRPGILSEADAALLLRSLNDTLTTL